MRYRLGVLLLAAAIAAPAVAQQWPDPPGAQQWPDSPPAQKAKPRPKPRVQPLDDVEELTPAQIKRAQERDPLPDDRPTAVKRPPKGGGGGGGGGGQSARQIACNGPFGKDSSHIRLAQIFGTQNVAFVEVEGPASSKLMASVVFPKEPRRRLEVLWVNDATRSGTQVIVINGQSGWSGPRGLRLGLQIAALEKLNAKPFKLTGFVADGSSVADWQGGALSSLPGGCKVGMRLVADRRASQDARSKVAAAKELMSNEAGVRAVRATVAEILIGY